LSFHQSTPEEFPIFFFYDILLTENIPQHLKVNQLERKIATPHQIMYSHYGRQRQQLSSHVTGGPSAFLCKCVDFLNFNMFFHL